MIYIEDQKLRKSFLKNYWKGFNQGKKRVMDAVFDADLAVRHPEFRGKVRIG